MGIKNQLAYYKIWLVMNCYPNHWAYLRMRVSIWLAKNFHPIGEFVVLFMSWQCLIGHGQSSNHGDCYFVYVITWKSFWLSKFVRILFLFFLNFEFFVKYLFLCIGFYFQYWVVLPSRPRKRYHLSCGRLLIEFQYLLLGQYEKSNETVKQLVAIINNNLIFKP